MKPAANDNGEEVYCPRCRREGFVEHFSGTATFGFALRAGRPFCRPCSRDAAFVFGVK